MGRQAGRQATPRAARRGTDSIEIAVWQQPSVASTLTWALGSMCCQAQRMVVLNYRPYWQALHHLPLILCTDSWRKGVQVVCQGQDVMLRQVGSEWKPTEQAPNRVGRMQSDIGQQLSGASRPTPQDRALLRASHITAGSQPGKH